MVDKRTERYRGERKEVDGESDMTQVKINNTDDFFRQIGKALQGKPEIKGALTAEKKARLDYIQTWVDYFINAPDFPGRLLWVESWILKYQAVLDERIK